MGASRRWIIQAERLPSPRRTAARMTQLWIWSTVVQATSLMVIAVFFVALARSVRLAEVRLWVWAWACNLFALLVTVAYWYFQMGMGQLMRAGYMGSKASYVLLLVEGAWALRHGGGRLPPFRYAALGLALYTAICSLLPLELAQVGVVQHTAMASVFLLGGLLLLARPRERGLGWLSAGLLIRGGLALVEAVAYGSTLLPALDSVIVERAAGFLSVHSSIDSGIEWVIALGCVIGVSEKVQRELRQANEDLLAAQEDLRRLVDRDPLTALANRRALPAVLRAVQPTGALLLFFDLDGFKQINDQLGHHAGDLCLKRFAEALRESFRPSDSVVRYAGDEFVVVAPGLTEASVAERLVRLRDLLKAGADGTPEIRFSVGSAPLAAAGGHPDAALKAADQSMYAARAQRPS
jgi:diguanylate cyclase (GGDEF)-like protein